MSDHPSVIDAIIGGYRHQWVVSYAHSKGEWYLRYGQYLDAEARWLHYPPTFHGTDREECYRFVANFLAHAQANGLKVGSRFRWQERVQLPVL